MSALSDYLEAQILNHTLRGIAMATPPTNVYVALFTAAPSDAGGGSELTGSGYARVAVPGVAGSWSVPVAGAGASVCTNAVIISFPTATANWAGPITHVGLFDAATGGNLLYHGALVSSKTVNSGDTLRFAASTISISLA